MTLKPILQTILDNPKIGGLTEFREWIDKTIYIGDREPKCVLFIHESEDPYHYVTHDIIETIKWYGEPTIAYINNSSKIVTIATHFTQLTVTFARWHQYERIVSLHGMDYVVIYLPRCETFLQRLLIATMP